MKVEVKEKVESYSISYPCLMKSINYNCIVLFSECKCGICIDSGTSGNIFGEYSDIWRMEDFIPFNGEITLKND